jgi:hypothetical protein
MAPSSATVNPPAMVKIAAKIQATITKFADPVRSAMAAILKNTPAPITVPTTADKAPIKPTSRFKLVCPISSSQLTNMSHILYKISNK